MTKAFSVIELIISVILITIMFSLFISKERIIPNFNGKGIGLETLKSDLIKTFPFKDSLELVCLERDLQCFVVIDGIIKKDAPIANLFEELPTIYKYSESFEIKEFTPIKIDESTIENVFFKFLIDRDYKTRDMVLFYKEKYYLYNALEFKAKVFNEQDSITTRFDQRLEEIKDAFSI